MAKEAIGFIHGVPENPDKKWKTQIGGTTFIFRKERVGKNGVFVYNCATERTGSDGIVGDSSTGFHSERDLNPEEVEKLPQFAKFIATYAAI